ncbi:LytTR family DNA-binding domain-containing protein [uncultured Psychroserpens sp.]|uniref:LytR/AlgR family response regulator transcription factor n=1 Tax=uncultured Psychroserpens sp. TaxID=255436 RepID=UPI0026174AA1|nr:LytTR family DNA-binding domain-containing protein [uncultured Psychroserpens sp.]
MLLTCLIIDDEPLARRRLSGLLKKKPDFFILGECKTGKEAIIEIEKEKPDVVFLDIEMKDMSGFDVLENIMHIPLVIFVTAYRDYAIKAFEFFAFDYLLKPFNQQRFDMSIERAITYFKDKEQDDFGSRVKKLMEYVKSQDKHTSKSFNQLTVKISNEVVFVDIATIKYICASGSYVDLYTDKKDYLIRSSLTSILNRNNNADLVRIHRSTIINIRFIEKVIYSNYGEIDVKMKDGSLFRISKSYKKHVQKLLGV